MFIPASWVRDPVKALIEERERIKSHTDTERERWRRMATDLRMQSVFSSKHLATRLTPLGWRIWFDCACEAAETNVKYERERLKEYAVLMDELNAHLAIVSEKIDKIHALDVSEKNLPRLMFDPLLLIEETVEDSRSRFGNGRLASLFGTYIKPLLSQLAHFDARYMPTVPQMLATLSWSVLSAIERRGNSLESGDTIMDAALSSRQHAPLSEYVRIFDEMMRHYEGETGGANFLMPVEVMATQAAVALNLNEVDKNQIKSARRLLNKHIDGR